MCIVGEQSQAEGGLVDRYLSPSLGRGQDKQVFVTW